MCPCLPGHPSFVLFYRGFWVGPASVIFLQAASQLLEEMVNLWSQLWQWLQVEIQKRQFGLSILPRFWIPPGRAILREGGRALLQPNPAVPPALSPGSSPLAVMTLRVGAGIWPASSDGLAQPLYLSSKAAVVARALQWASLPLVRSLSAEVSLLPLLGVLLLGGWTSARPGSSKPHSGLPSFCLRQSFREDTTLAVNSSICSGPQGGDPDSLLSLYT